MAFERLEVRLKSGNTSLPACLSIVGKSDRPSTWVTLRGELAAAAGLALNCRADVLLGRDEDAGKLRIVANEKGIIFGKQLKNSTTFNLGYVAAIGSARRPKRHCAARVIAAGMVEVDIGDVDAAEDIADVDDGATPDAAAPPPQPSPASGRGGAGSVPGPETLHGVTIDFSDGDESVMFKGKSTEVTARQARLIRLLARPRPAPVAESFLIGALWDGKPPALAAEQLRSMASDLQKGLSPIGLDLRLVKGAGYQLRDL